PSTEAPRQRGEKLGEASPLRAHFEIQIVPENGGERRRERDELDAVDPQIAEVVPFTGFDAALPDNLPVEKPRKIFLQLDREGDEPADGEMARGQETHSPFADIENHSGEGSLLLRLLHDGGDDARIADIAALKIIGRG